MRGQDEIWLRRGSQDSPAGSVPVCTVRTVSTRVEKISRSAL